MRVKKKTISFLLLEKYVPTGRKLFQSSGSKNVDFEESCFFMDFVNHSKQTMLRFCCLAERLMQTDFWAGTEVLQDHFNGTVQSRRTISSVAF